jgi:hypothetical protein
MLGGGIIDQGAWAKKKSQNLILVSGIFEGYDQPWFSIKFY